MLSRQGTIQIHVYLYLYHRVRPETSKLFVHILSFSKHLSQLGWLIIGSVHLSDDDDDSDSVYWTCSQKAKNQKFMMMWRIICRLGDYCGVHRSTVCHTTCSCAAMEKVCISTYRLPVHANMTESVNGRGRFNVRHLLLLCRAFILNRGFSA